MDIFCFPYAGGSSFMYSNLRRKLSGEHKVIPMEYPGHGMRMGEGLTVSLDRIIDDMFAQMKKKDSGSYFILLGYSLGSKLVYLLYEKYKEDIMFKRLKGIFFCASSMADLEKTVDYSKQSDEALMNYTIELGGSKFENEEDYESFKSFLPIIRNDFILYEYAKRRILESEYPPINTKVWIMYSKSEENIKRYNDYCSEKPKYEYFEGGHFFIHQYYDKMADYINTRLAECVV